MADGLQEIDWETSSDKDGPRQYAEMLVKETATLHKVLSKYLATSTVEVSLAVLVVLFRLTLQGVLSEVLAAIVHRLSEEYAKIELKSDDAKKRMTQDVALIKDRLAPLSESGSSVSSLETLVKDKPTPRRPIGQTMRGMLKRGGSESSAKPTEVTVPNGETGEGGEDRKSGEEEDDALTIMEEPPAIEDVKVEEKSEKKAMDPTDAEVSERKTEEDETPADPGTELPLDDATPDARPSEDVPPPTPAKEETADIVTATEAATQSTDVQKKEIETSRV